MGVWVEKKKSRSAVQRVLLVASVGHIVHPFIPWNILVSGYLVPFLWATMAVNELKEQLVWLM
jgi:hypothetical protein